MEHNTEVLRGTSDTLTRAQAASADSGTHTCTCVGRILEMMCKCMGCPTPSPLPPPPPTRSCVSWSHGRPPSTEGTTREEQGQGAVLLVCQFTCLHCMHMTCWSTRSTTMHCCDWCHSLPVTPDTPMVIPLMAVAFHSDLSCGSRMRMFQSLGGSSPR